MGARGLCWQKGECRAPSRNTVRYSVCAEMPGVVFRVVMTKPYHTAGESCFQVCLLFSPFHKRWLNLRPYLPYLRITILICPLKFFPSKFKCSLSTYCVQGSMHVLELSQLFEKGIDRVGGAVCRKNESENMRQFQQFG